MTKKEGMFYALGILKGNFECGKNYRTVNLGEILGKTKYSKYELGLSNHDMCVVLLDMKSPKENDMRRRVIEVNRHLYIDDLVHLLFDALAFDIKYNNEN